MHSSKEHDHRVAAPRVNKEAPLSKGQCDTSVDVAVLSGSSVDTDGRSTSCRTLGARSGTAHPLVGGGAPRESSPSETGKIGASLSLTTEERPRAQQRVWRISHQVPIVGCWLVPTNRTRPTTSVCRNGRPIAVRWYRLSFAAFNGDIPAGIYVLHHCDTPQCVNPAHLFLGTAQANMDDKYRKGRGRHLRGEASGNSKLTADRVRAIRVRAGSGDVYSRLAEDFGVSTSAIHQIVTRRTWRHVE